MDAANCSLACGLVGRSYVDQGAAALAARRRLVKSLLSNRALPPQGWDEATIEMLIQDAALMDSNTFPGQVGLGEREGRVACPLVARRHARLAHGIGRSGDITAEQPKAAGSSLLAKLCAALAADALKIAGLKEQGPAVVLPCATGMALTLVLLAAAARPHAPAAPAPPPAPTAAEAAEAATASVAEAEAAAGGGTAVSTAGSDESTSSQGADPQPSPPPALPSKQQPQPQQQPQQPQQQQQHSSPQRRFVVWSRIDQKTCLKAITAANLVPVVVELTRSQGGQPEPGQGHSQGQNPGQGQGQGEGQGHQNPGRGQGAGDELVTDVAGIRAAVERLGPDSIAAVVTTTSCFAPRACDDVVAVARLSAELGVTHVVNNAYGVQSAAIMAALTGACRRGRVDAVVQSTDKNFMVPVGGAVLTAPEGREGRGSWLVAAVAKGYPGRAAMTPLLDLLTTLLYWGAPGWRAQLQQREELYGYLKQQLGAAASQLGERLLHTPHNPISLAMTLDGLKAAAKQAAAAAAAGGKAPAAEAAPQAAACDACGSASGAADCQGSTGGKGSRSGGAAGAGKGRAAARADVGFFGAMLWARNVSGTRVLTGGKQQTIGGITFQDYGCHTAGYPHPYMTAAAAIGGSREEVDVFVRRMTAAYLELKAKWAASAGGVAGAGAAAAVAEAEPVAEDTES